MALGIHGVSVRTSLKGTLVLEVRTKLLFGSCPILQGTNTVLIRVMSHSPSYEQSPVKVFIKLEWHWVLQFVTLLIAWLLQSDRGKSHELKNLAASA